MSDLDRAVQAEIDAWAPRTAPPPLDALAGRKRARDRRRIATGAAALSAVAVAVAAALAPSLGDGRDELPTVAATGAEPTTSFTVLYRDLGFVSARTPERLDGCLALPGVEHGKDPTGPRARVVTVTGTAEARAFAACVRPITDVDLIEQGTDLAPSDADAAALAERCLKRFTVRPAPGLVGKTEREVFPPNARSALRVLARDGECTDERLIRDGAAYAYVVLDSGRVAWAGRPEDLQEGPVEALPVPPQDLAGAEICRHSADGDQCYALRSSEAGLLAGMLATGQPLQPGDAECAATPEAVYRVTFMPATGQLDPWIWEIPSVTCLPMSVGSTKHELPDDAQAEVGRIWDAAEAG